MNKYQYLYFGTHDFIGQLINLLSLSTYFVFSLRPVFSKHVCNALLLVSSSISFKGIYQPYLLKTAMVYCNKRRTPFCVSAY